MDLYTIYRKELKDQLEDYEAEYLEKITKDYPYFALPHYLKAKHDQSKENIFTASAYSVNRKLLKKYLEGELFFTDLPAETQKEEKSETAPVMLPDPKYRKPLHNLFSIIEFQDKQINFVPGQGLFSLSEGYIDESVQSPFLDWDLSIKVQKYKGVGETIKNELKINTESEPENTFQSSDSESVVEGKEEAIANEEKPIEDKQSVANSLIDQFLATQGNIKRKSSRLGSGQKTPAVVTESVTEDEDLVTETLARLHLLQNNPKEAIRIYEKLRLLFPEKSAYFDTQINKIKQT